MDTPLTTTMTIFQLLVAMISTLQTMQDTILVLTLIIVISTEGHIATIESGLEHNTGIISAQMSWRFIMKCLLKTVKQQKPESKTKTTTTTTTTVTTTNQRKINKQ